MNNTSRCTCGGKIVKGYMYGEQFIAGSSDLKISFRGKEQYLAEIFPSGNIPDRGMPARMCCKCLEITKE